MSVTAVIEKTKSVLAEDRTRAKITFATTNDLVGTTEVAVTTASGHEFRIDEPGALGGTDVAANPVEVALASLGACQAITYRFWAAHLGLELDAVNVAVEGDLDLHGFFGVDDAVRAGFGDVRVRVELSGPESPERYRELADAVDAHCPVLDVFRNPVPVSRAVVVAGS